MPDREQLIRERAYQLWELAGRPHEQSESFWLQAQREVEEAPPQGDKPCGAEEADAEPEPDAQQPAEESEPPTPAVEATATTRAARAVATPSARKSAPGDETSAPKRKAPRKR